MLAARGGRTAPHCHHSCCQEPPGERRAILQLHDATAYHSISTSVWRCIVSAEVMAQVPGRYGTSLQRP